MVIGWKARGKKEKDLSYIIRVFFEMRAEASEGYTEEGGEGRLEGQRREK